MIQLDLTGSHKRPLTHFALFGLAAIADAAGVPGVRIAFTDGHTPQAYLRADVGNQSVLADAVLAHASARAEDSWITATLLHEGRPNTGVMSPRLKTAGSPEAWKELQGRRRAELDRLTDRRFALDLAMIAGLGEPAYWRCTDNDSQPDQGASRWEMKTRNRGEEFVGNRLLPLARAVAVRTPTKILDGLVGAAIDDETGGNSADSRSGTGLAPPGPVDSALAWCALWGLTGFPVVHDGAGRSRTPGAYRWDRVHPRVMVLPVFTAPTSMPRVRSVIRSAALDRVAAALLDERPAEIAAPWLAEHGVRAVMRFDVSVVGSTSAPERRVLDGDVVSLASP